MFSEGCGHFVQSSPVHATNNAQFYWRIGSPNLPNLDNAAAAGAARGEARSTSTGRHGEGTTLANGGNANPTLNVRALTFRTNQILITANEYFGDLAALAALHVDKRHFNLQ